MFSQNASQTSIRYTVDGKGRPLKHIPADSYCRQRVAKGIVLTIDRRIQNGVQTIAEDMIDRGAVVVMEAHTGKIRACVSMPSFDPYNVAASLDDPGSPLVNRALKAYSVGSSFKLMVAAAALESGVSPNLTYTCTGAIDVGGQVFHCNDHEGHGTLDLRGALSSPATPILSTSPPSLTRRRSSTLQRAWGSAKATSLQRNQHFGGQAAVNGGSAQPGGRLQLCVWPRGLNGESHPGGQDGRHNRQRRRGGAADAS
ncbi:MAG: penicillin-binding transpeptidase domain-containing protein [Oscillospiraceae bacterium]